MQTIVVTLIEELFIGILRCLYKKGHKSLKIKYKNC